MSFTINISQFLKDSYDKKSVIGDKNRSYITFVKLCNDLMEMLLQGSASLAVKKKEISDEFSPEVARQKIAEVEKEYNERLDRIQRKLSVFNDELRESTLAQATKYYTAPMSDEDLRINQTAEMLKDSLTDIQWEMYIKRISEGGNYSALAKLNSTAEASGHGFSMPEKPDEKIEDINNIHTVFSRIIKNIGTPDKISLMDRNFITEGSEIYKILERFDSNVSTAIPDREESLLGRLNTARDVAYKSGDFETYNQIVRFLYNRSGMIASQDEVMKDVRIEAEALIQKGMSAGEN